MISNSFRLLSREITMRVRAHFQPVIGGGVIMAVALGWIVGLTPAVAAAPSWTNVTPAAGATPSAREGSGMAYDPATKQLVLFGGYGSGGVVGDTWTWNGSSWTEQHPSSSPSAREAPAMVYDAATSQLLLFGGIIPGAGQVTYGDTWVWTGSTWQQLQPSESPPARGFASIAYDSTSKDVVLFGGAATSNGNIAGNVADTWVWNGTTWASGPTGPSARDVASLATDPATGHLILFGGISCTGPPCDNARDSDTWQWNGSAWNQLSPATTPSGRSFAAMSYDPATASVVLFGGQSGTTTATALGDTWTWNGSTWAGQTPASSPAARGGSAAAYVPGEGVVLFGGVDASGSYLSDVWNWSGGATVARSGTRITLAVRQTSSKIRVEGAVTPSSATGTVKVILAEKKSGRFQTVSTHATKLVGGKYSVTMANPKHATCRATAQYGGDATHAPSSSAKTFTC